MSVKPDRISERVTTAWQTATSTPLNTRTETFSTNISWDVRIMVSEQVRLQLPGFSPEVYEKVVGRPQESAEAQLTPVTNVPHWDMATAA